MRRVMLAAALLCACQKPGPETPPAAARPSPAAATPRADTMPGGWLAVLHGEDGLDFVLHRDTAWRVDSVSVMRAGSRVQTLIPSMQEPAVRGNPTYRVDLDADGHLDFALATVVPMGPSVLYDYWRYDPAAARFGYVGEYPTLEPDSGGTLHTDFYGRYAGREWFSEHWRWENGGLVAFRRNEQGPIGNNARNGDPWVYTESELRGGRWTVVRADTLEYCEVEPLDEEACPPGAAPAPASGVQAAPRP